MVRFRRIDHIQCVLLRRGRKTYAVPLMVVPIATALPETDDRRDVPAVPIATALPETDDRRDVPAVPIATALPETDDRRDAPVDMSRAEVGIDDDGKVDGRDVLADMSILDDVVCAWAVARRNMMAPRTTRRRFKGCDVVCGIAGIVSWFAASLARKQMAERRGGEVRKEVEGQLHPFYCSYGPAVYDECTIGCCRHLLGLERWWCGRYLHKPISLSSIWMFWSRAKGARLEDFDAE